MLDLGGMGGGGLSVSPDGKYVAFQIHRADLRTNGYEAGWYVLDLTIPAKPILVGHAGDVLLFRAKVGNKINGAWNSGDPVWSPDSKWIAYRRMDGGTVQVWRSSIDGRIRERLTKSEASVEAFWWSKDGIQIWFETDATEQEQAEYLRSKWENGMWAGERNFRPSTVTYRMQPYEVTGGQPKLWVLDMASKRSRQANKKERHKHYKSNNVTVDTFFSSVNRSTTIPGHPLSSDVTVFRAGEKVAWLEADVEAVRPNKRVHARLTDKWDIKCEFDECFGSIETLWWSRDGREVVFRRGQALGGGRSTIYGWQIDKNIVRKVYTENAGHLSGCSSTGNSLICFLDEAAYPRVIAEVDFTDGKLTKLYDPNPGFGNILNGQAEWIEWQNKFGVETFAWLIKPIGYQEGKRYPLVIVQYRASRCFKGGTGDESPVHLFAAAGLAVLCFEQPILQELAETVGIMEYEQASWKGFYEKRVILSSLESAIDVLDERGVIEPSKVGITGLSSGANTISYALSHSNRFSAAIAANLGWGPTTYYYAARWVRALNRDRGFGRPGTKDDKYLSEMSLGMNAAKMNTPVLIQVSDDEARQSMFDYVTLQESGKPIDMYVYHDEYHVKWHPLNRKSVSIRAVDWMRFWLLGEEDDEPAKVEQYERWRKLRQQHEANLARNDKPG